MTVYDFILHSCPGCKRWYLTGGEMYGFLDHWIMRCPKCNAEMNDSIKHNAELLINRRKVEK